MKKILFCLCALALLMCCACAEEDLLMLPDGIVSIESEAFSDLPCSAVFVPRSVVSLASDAFGERVRTIYGYRGSASERAAQEAGKTFIPVDVSDIQLENPSLLVSAGAQAVVRANASAQVGELSFTIELLGEDGAVLQTSTGSVLSFTASECVYDVRVQASNGYDAQSCLFPAAVTGARPLLLAEESFHIDVGQSAALLDPAETRPVSLLSFDAEYLSADGLSVSGAAPGTAHVTLRCTHDDGRSFVSEVPVCVYPPATRLSVPSTMKLTVFEQAAVKVTLTPVDANPHLTWTSSNEKVAMVDEDGVVLALSGGTATITARAFSGKSASCTLTVNETKPTKLTANELFVSLTPGQSKALTYTIAPAAAQNKLASFQSSDEAVATVDEDGLVTAHSTGRCTVTMTSLSNSSVIDTCTVIVTREGAKRLEGVIIGVNPGHQRVPILRLYPIAPGSSTMKPGCKSGAHGIVSDKDEYEVNLEASLVLMQLLQQEGAQVVMTRTTNDVSLTNIERADILNRANVDAAIQVHCNGGSSSEYGISSYYRTTGDYVDESRLLAETLLSGMLSSTGGADRGVHVCNTYMSLNWSFTPAALVELGYMTNRTEDALLNDPAYQLKLAQGLVEGLCRYFGR